jgi:hypothetical protein
MNFWAPLEYMAHEHSTRVEEVLAVIEDQQEVLTAQCVESGLEQTRPRLLWDVECRCDRAQDEAGVREGSQVDQPHALWIDMEQL